MRARLTLAAGTAALALAGSVFAAAPAMAATSGSTPVTINVTGNATVAIDVDTTTKTLNAAFNGTVATGSVAFTKSTVTDGRGLGFTVVASSTGFTYSSGGDTSTTTALPASYGTLAATLGTVTGSINSTLVTPLSTGSLATPTGGPFLKSLSVGGVGTVEFVPTLSVTIPMTAANVGASYSGTVVQTVS